MYLLTHGCLRPLVNPFALSVMFQGFHPLELYRAQGVSLLSGQVYKWLDIRLNASDTRYNCPIALLKELVNPTC